jgi:hypothetical protein
MNASIVLWEQRREQIKQFFEGIHGHQKTALALVVIGIILAESAVLQRMAERVSLHGIGEGEDAQS